MSNALIGRLIAAVIFLVVAGIFVTQFTDQHVRTWTHVMQAVGWAESNRELNSLYQDEGYGAERTAESAGEG